MGAGQSDLYQGTYGDNPDNIPDEAKTGQVNKLPEKKAQLKHIFRNDEGHLQDTPENRNMLEKLANDRKCYTGRDKWGKDWNSRINNDGTQDWVRYHDGRILNGGRNKTPLQWNQETGFNKNPMELKKGLFE